MIKEVQKYRSKSSTKKQFINTRLYQIYVFPNYFGNLDLNSLVLDGWSAEYNEWAFKFPCPVEPSVIVAVENPHGSANRIFRQK
jgi:hypothetical protein